MFDINDAQRLLGSTNLSPQDRLTVAHLSRIPPNKWSPLDIDQLNEIAAKVERGEVYQEPDND